MATVVNSENYEAEVTNSAVPVMIDFYADWCGPCKMLMPLIEELAGEYEGKVKIVKIDVDASQDLAQKYSVMSIPTLAFIKDGEIADRVTGAIPKDAIAEKLDALI